MKEKKENIVEDFKRVNRWSKQVVIAHNGDYMTFDDFENELPEMLDTLEEKIREDEQCITKNLIDIAIMFGWGIEGFKDAYVESLKHK